MDVGYGKFTGIFCILSLYILCIPVFAIDSMTYGVGLRSSRGIYEVDFGAGTTNLLFSTPDVSWFGATDGDASNPNTFYATPYGDSLYRIDVVNKIATAVGSYGGPLICGLAYDETHDVLYATDYISLYTVDITSGSITEGAASLVGSFAAQGEAWAFDYDVSIDELVAVSYTPDGTRTYHVDRQTGQAELIGLSNTERITDVWYAPSSQKMFGVSNNPYEDIGNFYEINSTNGEFTLIGSFKENLLGLGKPVPEPATIVLLVFGGLAAIQCKKH